MNTRWPSDSIVSCVAFAALVVSDDVVLRVVIPDHVISDGATLSATRAMTVCASERTCVESCEPRENIADLSTVRQCSATPLSLGLSRGMRH